MSLIAQIAVFLGAAVLVVPLFQRLGLGSMLGYLAAGVAIGPWGLRYRQDAEDVMHFAEFGVVLMLFLVGLELQPRACGPCARASSGSAGAGGRHDGRARGDRAGARPAGERRAGGRLCAGAVVDGRRAADAGRAPAS